MRLVISVFAKAPVPGLAKTRLIPLLGARGAARLARRMLDDTLKAAGEVAGVETQLWVTPPATDPQWRDCLPAGVSILDQGQGDLGERLARAARSALAQFDGLVLIGTDCPALDRGRLAAAAAALRSVDAFVQPALDGGYVLLALRRFSPILFSDIAWGGPDVCSATLARLDRLGWAYEVGEALRDVDQPDDVLASFDPEVIAALHL